MKRFIFRRLRPILPLILGSLALSAAAQDTSQLIVKSPFDSLSAHDVKAVGNLQTGSVEITMQVRNDYLKHWVALNFTGGAFEGFGVTDDKGTKYKVYSNDHLMGTAGINNGYGQIWALMLGKSTPKIFITVYDTLQPGQVTTLRFRLGRVNKMVHKITELHMLAMFSLEYTFAGQKEYIVKNLPINWIKPASQATTANGKAAIK